jgi:hypothetical protein
MVQLRAMVPGEFWTSSTKEGYPYPSYRIQEPRTDINEGIVAVLVEHMRTMEKLAEELRTTRHLAKGVLQRTPGYNEPIGGDMLIRVGGASASFRCETREGLSGPCGCNVFKPLLHERYKCNLRDAEAAVLRSTAMAGWAAAVTFATLAGASEESIAGARKVLKTLEDGVSPTTEEKKNVGQ